ncbi:hypothetical protein FDP41_004856 [Naegleria fowleri]|uniref:Ubiquitin fusion degradation protein UFD1 N-terminal subdomain 2 domain-containing protein n=1 Tax=Naegleria fowleri TaxID=5763 RepID=A0A6A5BPL3_NAEFO|nr:uncharacterized protein FDP41_004856 [Naegleria fowleri]KAF0976181.1 hypothetical protein FDP41_004856 [Naegleria fowleri]
MQNHKSLLENAYRNFSTLNEGMSIPVVYGRKSYFIEVLKCEPDYSICVISDHYLDIKVDFAPALDFDDEEEKRTTNNSKTTEKPSETSLSTTFSSIATSQPPVVIDNVDMIECENCKRAVSQRTYVMHLSHCKRNVYNCTKCNNVVKLSEKESHSSIKNVNVLNVTKRWTKHILKNTCKMSVNLELSFASFVIWLLHSAIYMNTKQHA